MSLELYLRDGVYWFRGRIADGDNYQRRSLRTSDEAIAQAKVRAIEAAARKRSILGPDAPKIEDELTFSAAVKDYRNGGREAIYLRSLVHKIGNKRVRDITPRFVRQLGAEMMPYASTETWQREIVSPVRSVINSAHELGKCAPIRIKRYTEAEMVKQDVFRGKQSRVPKKAGSWPWLLAFMGAAEPRYAALAYFMFRHGYRLSQSISMTRKRDLDLTAGRVRVHASKGHPAHWVELDPEEVVMIANLPVPYRGKAKDRVFTIAGGRSGALYVRWKAICAAAGIEYLPPHSSGRHGYATEMVVRQHGKVDLIAAAEDKWSDPGVMLKTYSHSEDGKARVRDAFRAGKEAARTLSVQPKTRGARR